MRLCGIPDCGRKHHIRGWCRIHYMRWQRNGDPNCGDLRSKGGISSHPLYGAWNQMINRCENPNNSSYGRYGARGVTVCHRWHDFRNFLADMGERPAGKTLDRIDPYGPYAPENCRWATIKEQRANITPEGDMRARKAMSEAVKHRWRKWREAGNVAKPKHTPAPPRQPYEKACERCGAQFRSIRSDARFCSVRCGSTANRHLKRAMLALE